MKGNKFENIIKTFANKYYSMSRFQRALIGLCAMVLFVIAMIHISFYIVTNIFYFEEPAKPPVTYAEFPYEIVYEFQGKQVVEKDIIVIEYEGVKWSEASGKFNKWNVYRKNSKEIIGDTLKIDIFSGFVSWEKSSVGVFIDLGCCEHYMGLEEVDIIHRLKGIEAGDIVMFSSSYNGPISEEELYEKFQIKIIKISLSPPISTRNSNGD